MVGSKVFAAYRDAQNWMLDSVDDQYADNDRFAFLDDPAAMFSYGVRKDQGCCGSFDAEVTVGGRKAVIGCNYGH